MFPSSFVRPWLVPLLFAFGVWPLASGLPSARALDLMPHSFSRSKQFVVYAREGAVRGAVGTLGEETKAGLLAALGQKDDWRLPIVIDLRAPEPSVPDSRAPVRLTLAQTGSGLKIELDLLIGGVARGTRVRDELVRALLLELAYRQDTTLPAGQAYTTPPPWLVEGLSAYLENQEDGVSASMFAALLPTTQALSVTEFLSRDPAVMDSTSHAVYRAYAFNLVCLLLRELPGGRAGLLAFVHDLPKTTAENARGADALSQHFPALAETPDSLEKWWTLGLAHLAESDRYQVFSVPEMEQRLLALTSFTLPADARRDLPNKTYTLMDFREFIPSKRSRPALENLQKNLAALGGQANPLYRQIVAGYQEVVATLVRGRMGGVEERLRALTAQRQEVLKCREGIADYMNWYEATQAPTQSGAFEEYFHSVRQLDARQRVHRPDPISVYLDGLGTEFR